MRTTNPPPHSGAFFRTKHASACTQRGRATAGPTRCMRALPPCRHFRTTAGWASPRGVPERDRTKTQGWPWEEERISAPEAPVCPGLLLFMGRLHHGVILAGGPSASRHYAGRFARAGYGQSAGA